VGFFCQKLVEEQVIAMMAENKVELMSSTSRAAEYLVHWYQWSNAFLEG
jgi:hypothetical protein